MEQVRQQERSHVDAHADKDAVVRDLGNLARDQREHSHRREPDDEVQQVDVGLVHQVQNAAKALAVVRAGVLGQEEAEHEEHHEDTEDVVAHYGLEDVRGDGHRANVEHRV